MRNRTLFALAAPVLLVMAGLLYAGPLDPPVGPISSTNKTLTDVEPRTAINAANTPGDADSLFVINRSGSYYLTSDIQPFSGRNGIKIDNVNASNVTIDLNGFTIRGSPGSLAGIRTTSFPGGTSLAIRNGAVATMGGAGMDVYSQAMSLTDVTVEFCAPGFVLSGDASTISRCRSFFNTGDGFSSTAPGTITECTSEFNTANGFTINSGQRLTACVAVSNTSKAISAGFGCDISECRVNGAGAEIITVTSGCSVQRCLINVGSGTAIRATSTKNTIQDNNMSGGSAGSKGIVCDVVGNFVVRNTSTGITTPYTLPASTFAGTTVNTAAGVATAGPWSNFAY